MFLLRQTAKAHAGLAADGPDPHVTFSRLVKPAKLFAKAGKSEVATTQSRTTSSSTGSSSVYIHNNRLPYWQVLEELSKPIAYQLKVLQGHKYAWGRSLLNGEDVFFVADADFARSILRDEANLGTRTNFPSTASQLLGEKQMVVTQDPELHAQLRHIMAPYLTTEAVQRLMPNIHATVQKHMARWAASAAAIGPVDGYEACRSLTFDVMVNQGLQISMSDDEVQEYAGIFSTWVAGFMPPAINLPIFPFGRGLRAREKLVARARAALHDPHLPPSSLTARLRDEYGPDSDVAVDNMVGLLFAGHDTTSSALTYLLWQLGRHPAVMEELRTEQAAVQEQYGPGLSPAALSAMQYTAATAKEAIRLARISLGIARKATKDINSTSPSMPAIASGCPFLVAIGVISMTDPAVAGDSEDFKPERWLDPKNARSLAVNQMPWGYGQHFCLGSTLATAELTAAMTVLAREYHLGADADVLWVDFPIKKASKFFGVNLVPLNTVKET